MHSALRRKSGQEFLGAPAFLRPAIWAHRKIVEHFGAGTNFLCDPFE
jgi:hypothetical protein